MKKSITLWRGLDQFQDRGVIVRYNPEGDDNCQFSVASIY